MLAGMEAAGADPTTVTWLASQVEPVKIDSTKTFAEVEVELDGALGDDPA
jgi:hypothetical protein